MVIYSPAEDSCFLSESIVFDFKDKMLKALDMGSGSGFQAKTLIGKGIDPKKITLVDINPKVIVHLKKNFPKSRTIKSDLFLKVNGKYDLIVFNPPYLPEDKYDQGMDTSGGKEGDETIVEFLKQLNKHLNKDGKCFLLTSSLTPMTKIKQEFKNYNVKIVAHKKLFFEELFVHEICLKK